MSDARSGPDHPPTGRRWGALEGILALVTAIGLTLFAGIPAVVIGEDSGTAEVTGNAISMLLQNVIFVGAPIALLGVMGYRATRGDLGWRAPRRTWLAIGLLVAAAVTYLLLSAGLAHLLGVADEQDDLPDELGVNVSALAAIVIGLAVTVLAPIGEETLLRGVVYPGLRTTFGKVAPGWLAIALAAIIDGLLFGALHAAGTDIGFLPILALFGAILCLLYQWTGSLYLPIVLHATNNTVAITQAADWSAAQGLALWVVAMAILTGLALGIRRGAGDGPLLPAR
ncbi:type II CAAX endopeptidase family protein [Patulibacter brassicae]|uniref:Type II CAAX endopeptidase family protein n=1 Tax=Patulibacter brassicae TaxID=1705717 RepID=A0ABU4VR07_9ACTN|nr:type II CAAX endopeptidase family protein [Patulibacter brassicae]MDX8153376.1 type II CAAX endopeptidase family protein [Patulibacter brassicae]